LAGYDTELGCINRYRNAIRRKAALIIMDDIWRAQDVEPFLAESRVPFTVHDSRHFIAAAVGAEEHVADLLTTEQSREVLAQWSE